MFTWFRKLRAWLRADPGHAKEFLGYVALAAVGIVVGVPEIWAAADSSSVPWPTISGMTGDLEYHHDWVAIIVIAVIVWAGMSAVYRGGRLVRTPHGGRLTLSRGAARELPWFVYLPVALIGVVVPSLIVNEFVYPHDKFRFGQVMYGLIAFFWIVIPTVLALPTWGLQAPFPTFFRTLRNLQRRVHAIAVVVVTGLAVLVIHLVLYPWPAIIPDLKDAHDIYSKQRAQKPAPSAPKAPSPYSP